MSDTSPEPASPQSESRPNAPIEIDLYCLECGYNLRGLSGDPVRCPECAFLSPAGNVEVPASAIRVERRGLHALAIACVIGLILLVPGIWGLYLALSAGYEPISCPLCATAIGLPFLCTGLIGFGKCCRGLEGWFAALVRLIVLDSLACVVGIGVLAGGIFVAAEFGDALHGSTGGFVYPVVVFIAYAATVGVALWGARLLAPYVTAPAEQLLREAATRRARDRARRKTWGLAADNRPDR